MRTFALAPRAIADMKDIAAYSLEIWGEEKAIDYLDALRARFAWLARNPLKGRPRDEVRLGLRSFRQGSHLVFYLIDTDMIQIVGIPHASMDLDAYFD